MTTAKVVIRQFETSIDVRAGQTILDAALKAGLDFPYACRAGNCSSCKSQLFSGTVEMKPYDPSALTAAERADGLILACRSCPTSDCDVAFVEEEELTFAPAEYACTITALDRVTPDVVVMRARSSDGKRVNFSAGQFGMLSLMGKPPREFSIASRPGAPELEFHVRTHQGGDVSAQLYHHSAIGDAFRLKAPFGNAYLRKAHAGPILLVVGGTGLAPAQSILLDALLSLPGRPVSLYFSVRHAHDLYQVDSLRALADKHPHFRFHPIVTRAADRPRTTVIDLIDRDFSTLDGVKVYTCGSPALVAACRDYVLNRGVAPGDCHADPFTAASVQVAEPA